MGIAHDAASALGHAARDVHAGADKLASRKLPLQPGPRLDVSSPTFGSHAPLPRSSTVDGAGTPPAIEWSPGPAGTQSFVLLCEDPDAPFPEPFVHWIVYGIPNSAASIDARSVADFKQGKNSKLTTGFTPAAPPPGHGMHKYHFQVFALDVATDFEGGLGRSSLVDRMKGHVLAWGELVGTFERA